MHKIFFKKVISASNQELHGSYNVSAFGMILFRFVLGFVIFFYIVDVYLYACIGNNSNKNLIINIICDNNGYGTEADREILTEALERFGCFVKSMNCHDSTIPDFADINLFVETLVPDKFPYAIQNWFIPNPDWYLHCKENSSALHFVDLVLCRTREVERIFNQLHPHVYYLGFTSRDCYRPQVEKNYGNYFHLAGKSPLKGTKTIQNIWELNASLPFLTVIDVNNHWTLKKNIEWYSYRVSESKLRDLQNAFGIHLCPSETEGFGHYLVEAMSVGAVILTTDAPPMNEFIKDPRCLIESCSTGVYHLAKTYQISPDLFRKKILSLRRLSSGALEEIGLKNRNNYLLRKQEFYDNFSLLINNVQHQIHRDGFTKEN